jgi:hypothetical protein
VSWGVWRRASAAALYLAGCLLFFECSARLALQARPLPALRRLGNDDASWRLRWASRQRDSQPFTFSFDVHHPTRGWALAPGLRDLSVFRDKRLSSNSRGLRGRREHAPEIPFGLTRVLVFGDSFTFGENVSDQDTYPAQLEAVLGNAEVLNFGVHGYGHDQMLLYLREEGLRYRTDIVVLGFVAADVERNILRFGGYAKPCFDLVEGRLALRNTPVPPPGELLRMEPYRSKFLDLLSIIREGWRWSTGANQRRAQRLTAAILDAFRSEVERTGARFVIVYLPTFQELEPGPETEAERFVSAHGRERGVAVLDLRPSFIERLAAGRHLKTTGHWNRGEHRLAAESLATGLSRAGWLAPATIGQVPP